MSSKQRRNRNWNMIRKGLDDYRFNHQVGTMDIRDSKPCYIPYETWHAEDCTAKETVFEPGKGHNGFHCPKCNLRFAVFVHMNRAGHITDWSVHRQFDYSLQAQREQELKFAARRPAEVNPLGDVLGTALVEAKAKDMAAENFLLLQRMREKLEKDLLGSHVFHAAMKELPVMLQEARA